MSEKTAENRRFLPIERALVRVESTKDTVLSGYAAIFNDVAYGEMIDPGAFDACITDGRDIGLWYNHDMGMPMASTGTGTLRLWADEKGLAFEAKPNMQLSWVRDCIEAVKSGLIKGMSFGAMCCSSRLQNTGKDYVDVLTDIPLHEISVCTMPWYESTSVEARDKRAAHAERMNIQKRRLSLRLRRAHQNSNQGGTENES